MRALAVSDTRRHARGRDRAAAAAHRQSRHRRLGPRAAIGLRRARRPPRAERRGRRRHVRLERRSREPDTRARRPRSGNDAVHRHVEDVHDDRDARQRAGGTRLADARARRRRCAVIAFHCGHRQRRRCARVRRRGRRRPADLGLGWRTLFAVVRRPACRSPFAAAGSRSSNCSPARASLDSHFREAPLERNLPVLLALVDLWNAQWLGLPQRIIVPYAHALQLLPSYLQQLALESNGKSVARDGSPLRSGATAALWGGTGTDGQHAYFQWLHQGTQTVPVEFIVPVRAAHPVGRSAGHARRKCAGAGAGADDRPRSTPACGPSSRAKGIAGAQAERKPHIAYVPAIVHRQCCCCRNSMRGGWANCSRSTNTGPLSKASCWASIPSISGASSWAKCLPNPLFGRAADGVELARRRCVDARPDGARPRYAAAATLTRASLRAEGSASPAPRSRLRQLPHR